ncbi:MAG TPA: aminotransferase class V-fold PLP-dependent enzyme, partial [Vampirovibrionales bacterium]
LGEAINYLTKIGMNNIEAHEEKLLNYATEKMLEIEGLKIHGNSKNKASLISFTINDVHPSDMAMLLDKENSICIRVGHHCAQPLMSILGASATARASFGLYNTLEEVDTFIESLKKVLVFFR